MFPDPKKILTNKIIDTIAPDNGANSENNATIKFESKIAKKIRISPIKPPVPGIAALPRSRIKKIEDNVGNEELKP